MSQLKYKLHYFTYRLNREVKEVYWHTFLYGLALSMVFIFEPIYLYSLGYSLAQIMFYYLQVYVWYALLIFLGAKFASRFGYKHSIMVSNIFYLAYWFVLFSIKSSPFLFFAAPLLFALQKSFFWPAYDADVALSSVRIQRGREVGVLFSLLQIGAGVGPFLGGIISQELGFRVLFAVASVLMLFSAYPLFRSRDMYTTHRFKFENLWRILRSHVWNFFGYFGYAEDLILMSLWPIYMFIVIPDFLNVGLVTTIATVIGTVLMLFIGRLTDRTDKSGLIKFSSIFYGITWLVRFFAKGLLSVLGFDVLTKASKDTLNVPMVALTFEHAGSKGADYAIAYSVFFEFSLSIGKIVTALLAIALLASGASIFLVFALVGIMTWLYTLLK